MEYNFIEIERKWRKHWAENKTFAAEDNSTKPKYYVLDMFPYPSGAGLHVGHPLGYIASDIYARYKRLRGFNVLHPMGYDSFGLPAEQYAIQTGLHPKITTSINIDGCLDEKGEIKPEYVNPDGSIKDEALIAKSEHVKITDSNYQDNIIKGYRNQLDKIGFSFDWDREVRTSSPEYYKWTQWIFKQIFNSWYNTKTDKAEPIDLLIAAFEADGNLDVQAVTDYTESFSANGWKAKSEKEQSDILMEYRLAYLADSWVNWCPALGTVLANDEVINGLSERGGHPVEQKLMRQWSMRIKAYAERLLTGLDTVDWTDAIKDMQRNWIGKSVGCSVSFPLWRGIEGEDSTQISDSSSSVTENAKIEVFTTRPDTIFGVSFMVLAPEHPLVNDITTDEYRVAIEAYKTAASLKSERDRQADVKNITGQFTGAYAVHPFSGEKIPVWIGDYVLASYGTGAVMAVPCGDQRDWDFAKHFNIPIKNIFENVDISEVAYTEKEGTIADSDFLTGLSVKEAMKTAIAKIEEQGLGKGKTNYRLRDAIFSRQRYWGEPFPVYYKNDIPYLVDDSHLPVELPEVDKYLPTEDGEPPLARAEKSAWKYSEGDRMEYNTMPGWAGSSFYFLRYMDPHNTEEFVSKDKSDYWNQVDLYIGGSEHATGHLLYSRFWCKFLYDKGFISFEEPFAKMINQGMILGNSRLIYRYKYKTNSVRLFNELGILNPTFPIMEDSTVFYSADVIDKFFDAKEVLDIFSKVHIDINCVDGENVDLNMLLNWRENEFKNAAFVTSHSSYWLNGKMYFSDGTVRHDTECEQGFKAVSEVEKMSKSKFNVQTPDDLVEKFGADTLRMYEMFLGPLEQTKPWDTKGISGVHNFLRKLWRLFFEDGKLIVTTEPADKASLKTLHKTIKKVEDDLERYSFNTNVSNLMICVNELTEQKCHSKEVLEELVVLLAPYAPHAAEELWEALGYTSGSISTAHFPTFNPDMLVEANVSYPVSFNGKMRFNAELPTAFTAKEVEEAVMAMPEAQKWLEGKTPKKVIVVPGKIVNIVI